MGQRCVEVGGPADVMALAVVRTMIRETVGMSTTKVVELVFQLMILGFVCFGSGGSAVYLFS